MKKTKTTKSDLTTTVSHGHLAMSNLFHNSLDSIFIYNYEIDLIVFWNNNFTDTYNVEDRKELLFMEHLLPQLQLNGSSSKEILVHQIKLVHQTKKARRFYIEQKKYNGYRFSTETTIIPSQNASNNELTIIVKDKTKEFNQELISLHQDDYYKDILFNSSVGILQTDFDGIIQFASPSLDSLFGFQPGESIGQNIIDFLKDEYKFYAKEKLRDLLVKNEPISKNIICIRKDGKEIYIHCSVKLIQDSYNIPSNFTFSIVELPENQYKTREIFAPFIANSNLNLFQVNKYHEIIFASNQAIKQFNYSKTQKAIDDIFSEQSTAAILISCNNIAIGKSENEKCFIEYQTDKCLYFECNINQIDNSEEFIIILTDITERIDAEFALINRETTLNTVIENSNLSMYAFDQNYNIIFSNTKCVNEFKKYYGIDFNVGENIKQIFNKELFTSWKEQYFTDVLDGKKFSKLLEIDKEKKVFNLCHFTPLQNIEDKQDGVLVIAQDISEYLEKEKALSERKATLSAVLNSSPASIYAIDKSFEVIGINGITKEYFKTLHGIDLKEGDNLKEILPKQLFNEWNKTIFSKVFEGEIIEQNKVHINEGEDLIMNSRIAPVTNPKGEIIGCVEIARDISEERKNEEALLISEKKYREIFENNLSGMAFLERGVFVDINPAYSRLVGYSREDLLGRSPFDLIPQKDKTYVEEKITKLQNKEIMESTMIHRLNHKYGHELTVMIQNYARYDEKGDYFGNFVCVTDLTELKQKENALQESEKKYRELIELIPGGIIISELDGKQVYISPQTKTMFGYSADEDLLGSSIFDFFVAEESYDFINFDDHQEDQKHIIRVQGKKKDGSKIHIEGYAKLIQNEGRPLLLTTIFDVSEKFFAEKEREERQAIYKALIENSFDGIDIVEIDSKAIGFSGNLLMRNQKMKYFLGDTSDLYISKQEFLKISSQIQTNKDSEKVFDDNKRRLFKKQNNVHEWTVKNDDVTIDTLISEQILNINDKLIYIRNFKDISDQKKKESVIQNQIEELNKKNDVLEKYIESNMNLENFAYVASHDLKSPLRTISSFAQLLHKNLYDTLDNKNKVFIDIIRSSADNMQNLVNDLLTYSRVNSQKSNFEDFQLKQFIDFQLKQLHMDISQSRAEIEFKNLPTIITADKIKISQVIMNLIRNAIKFSRDGITPKIIVSGTQTEDMWKISIKDNGIGIDKELVGQIFDIFKKLHSNDKFKGNGLGLAICKKIIEQHRGDIWVDSVMGEGSTFYFTISKHLNKK